MNVLSLDCSFGGFSLAIKTKNELVTEHQAELKASENIIPSLDKLLAKTKLKLNELDLLSCAVGPGRFSGIRTACGTIQGIAFVHEIKVALIKTPLAIAHANNAKKVIVAYPAHRDHCYLAAYEFSNTSYNEIAEPTLYSLENIPKFTGDWEICTRDNLDTTIFKDKVAGNLNLINTTVENLAPAVAELGLIAKQMDKLVLANEVKPLYIRNKIALTKAERAAGITL